MNLTWVDPQRSRDHSPIKSYVLKRKLEQAGFLLAEAAVARYAGSSGWHFGVENVNKQDLRGFFLIFCSVDADIGLRYMFYIALGCWRTQLSWFLRSNSTYSERNGVEKHGELTSAKRSVIFFFKTLWLSDYFDQNRHQLSTFSAPWWSR